MRERPILFSGPMVRAILDGRKTQTRRICKPQPPDGTEGAERQIAGPVCIDAEPGTHFWRWLEPGALSAGVRCPYGQPGDRLWVRETWTEKAWTDAECAQSGCAGAPTHPENEYLGERLRAIHRASYSWPKDAGPWRSSIHMPRWASRITLGVTGVRVERVQDISEADAKAEGAGMYVVGHGPITADDLAVEPGYWSPTLHRNGFAALWQEINGKRAPWESNPWVWVVEFRKL